MVFSPLTIHSLHQSAQAGDSRQSYLTDFVLASGLRLRLEINRVKVEKLVLNHRQLALTWKKEPWSI